MTSDLQLFASHHCESNILTGRSKDVTSSAPGHWSNMWVLPSGKETMLWELLSVNSNLLTITEHLVPPCGKENVLLGLCFSYKMSIKQYCPAATAQSPHHWRWEGFPHHCPGGACWCGRRPVRTSTLCCLGGACHSGTAGEKRRSWRVSQGWREQQWRQWPRYTHPAGRAGQGWGLAEKGKSYKEKCFLSFSGPSSGVKVKLIQYCYKFWVKHCREM